MFSHGACLFTNFYSSGKEVQCVLTDSVINEILNTASLPWVAKRHPWPERGQWRLDISLVNIITDFSCKTKTSSYNIRADILRLASRSLLSNLRITFARWSPISLMMAQSRVSRLWIESMSRRRLNAWKYELWRKPTEDIFKYSYSNVTDGESKVGLITVFFKQIRPRRKERTYLETQRFSPYFI